MFARKLFLALTLSAAALSQSACSSSSGGFVQGVHLGNVEQNGVEYVEVRASLNTQGLFLTALTVPVFDPKNPTQIIGQVSIIGGLGNKTAELSVLIRSDILPQLPSAGQGVLPNGTLIPVAGVDRNKWVTISVGSSSKVYLNIDQAQSSAVLGVALGIDALTTGVIANVLIPFNSNNVSGLAGIYSGAGAGQSGFAFFINMSGLLQPSMGIQTLARGVSAKTTVAAASSPQIQFLEKASNTDSIRVQRRIIQLQSANVKLKVR
ncbi:MAG: hypothetical protein KF789_06550 [Bdellovibrionaceae bacterium]|nr:hypothetical protein [Pseudobdellovibrionaceae bacterium]